MNPKQNHIQRDILQNHIRYVTTNPSVVRNVVAVSACGCLDNSQIIDQVQIAGHRDTAYNGIYHYIANSIANGKKRIYRKQHDIYRSMSVYHLPLHVRVPTTASAALSLMHLPGLNLHTPTATATMLGSCNALATIFNIPP
jgi:hypothetical protein